MMDAPDGFWDIVANLINWFCVGTAWLFIIGVIIYFLGWLFTRKPTITRG